MRTICKTMLAKQAAVNDHLLAVSVVFHLWARNNRDHYVGKLYVAVPSSHCASSNEVFLTKRAIY